MGEGNKKVIRVSPATDTLIRGYAEKKGIPVGDAADSLITTAIGRLGALEKHRVTRVRVARKSRSRKKRTSTAPPPALTT